MVIYKYPLALRDTQTVRMPQGATLLDVLMQGGGPVLYALVSKNTEIEDRRIAIYGTGHDIPRPGEYVATVSDGKFVWHIFDETR